MNFNKHQTKVKEFIIFTVFDNYKNYYKIFYLEEVVISESLENSSNDN